MKKMLVAALTAGIAMVAVSPAMARQGCGDGFHRGPGGGCQPNGYGRGRGVVVGGPVVAVGVPRVGVYYGGRGYWDGHRYWKERYRYRNGWRYR